MPLLKFKEWESINESSVLDKIKNWISDTFGGSVSKLDNILSSYKKLETKFVEEWEDIKTEIDKLELERDQIKNDPAEAKKIIRQIERQKSSIDAAAKVHEKSVSDLLSKAKSIVDENKRLKTYWETKKSKVDSEVAEDMYKIAKKLTSKTEAEKLYSKYKEAVLAAKKRDEEFKEVYGNLMGHKTTASSDKLVKSDYKNSDTDASFEMLSKLDILEFAEAVKELSPDVSKKLASYLIKERNDLYVAMDMERDGLNTEIERMPKDSKTKEYAAQRIKEIREKYLSKIRDLRSKITISRRHDK